MLVDGSVDHVDAEKELPNFKMEASVETSGTTDVVAVVIIA
jgi:hypothetical protein